MCKIANQIPWSWLPPASRQLWRFPVWEHRCVMERTNNTLPSPPSAQWSEQTPKTGQERATSTSIDLHRNGCFFFLLLPPPPPLCQVLEREGYEKHDMLKEPSSALMISLHLRIIPSCCLARPLSACLMPVRSRRLWSDVVPSAGSVCERANKDYAWYGGIAEAVVVWRRWYKG